MAGRELNNARLASALLAKKTGESGMIEFTPEEWNAFGIIDLRRDDYIRVGDSFLQPRAYQGDDIFKQLLSYGGIVRRKPWSWLVVCIHHFVSISFAVTVVAVFVSVPYIMACK